MQSNEQMVYTHTQTSRLETEADTASDRSAGSSSEAERVEVSEKTSCSRSLESLLRLVSEMC